MEALQAAAEARRSGIFPCLSVVIPFFNEEGAIRELLCETLAVMSVSGRSFECLCVDDGSRDRTLAMLREIEALDPRVRVIRFERNRGQAAALYRGLMEARGEVLVTLDGDGQNDPQDIPVLLERLRTSDLVCGVRQSRHDSLLRRGMSRVANAVRGRLLNDGMRDSGCALKAMRAEVVHALLPIRTLYSFIPAQATAAGFRVSQVPVRHRARHGGRSSYGLRAFAWWPLVDMLGLAWYRRRCVLCPGDCMAPSAGGNHP